MAYLWPKLVLLAEIFCLIRENVVSVECPMGTVNYKNESCYLFIDKRITADLYVNIWKQPRRMVPKLKCRGYVFGVYRTYPCNSSRALDYLGYTRGRIGLSMDPCVWNQKQARDVCAEVHKHADYKHLAPFAKAWHLPIIETYEDDQWLNEIVTSKHPQMGTHFWIDLVKLQNTYHWESTGRPVAWFHLPAGIDRWWERCKVLMKPKEGHTKLCYEFHTDYNSWTDWSDTTEHYATNREPFISIKVRGWHPRDCEEAYEQESDLDHADDFTELQLTQGMVYWEALSLNIRGCAKTISGHCVLPEAEYRPKCESEPRKFYRGKYRMRQAPVGVVCEAPIECFGDNPTAECDVEAAQHQHSTTSGSVMRAAPCPLLVMIVLAAHCDW